MEKKFEKSAFGARLFSMLAVDFKRMAVSSFFYIMIGISVVLPILIIVMTTMAGGPTIDPETGAEIGGDMFTNAWQAISSPSGADAGMELTSMCNMNLMYFALAVFACVFIADDFRSGYAKNLFAVRARKGDYVISKIISCFFVGCLMILGFFAGAMVAAAVSGLPFGAEGITAENIVFCMLAKLLLVLVFAGIYVMTSVIAKQRTWLSMCLSLGVGMLLFMMIPAFTPLDATIANVILCLAGGLIFAFGLGSISRLVLKKRDIL